MQNLTLENISFTSTKQFESLIYDITKENLKVLEVTKDGKWYEVEFSKCDQIKEDTKYGVFLDREHIFDLKLGKIESFVKTFITQYVNKYLSKQQVVVGEYIEPMGKTAAQNSILRNLDNARLGYKTLYSTNYGIGQWIILNSRTNIEDTEKSITTFLQTKSIPFTTEYSDAHWVYRYKISGNFVDHNALIAELSQTI